MSTRYVWNQSNRLATYSLSEREALIGIIASINPLSVSKQGTGFVGSNGMNGPYLEMEDYEDKYFEDKEQYTVPAGRFFGNEWTDPSAFYPILYAQTDCVVRGESANSGLSMYIRLNSGTAYEVDAVWGAGASLGTVSGTSQSTYPDDGVSGNYWYTYQGQDNIDPGAVSIPSTIKGGTAITISVTPGSGKRYGGTVSYIYEVQLNGGSWTQVSTTTATNVSYTVSKGAEMIRARVRARDNLGFTSATYVQSNQVAVQNSNVHAGVNRVVRNVETAVCVSGVIRTADCYACVNGVIRSC